MNWIPNGDTWMIADTHFFHVNIARYCNRPDDWQERVIVNWNVRVAPGDDVFCLGDLAMNTRNLIQELVPTLNGKIYLLRGNHDRRGAGFYRNIGVTLIEGPMFIEYPPEGILVFSHRPMPYKWSWDINLHGHVHNKPTKLGLDYINVGVDVMGFKPWRLADILLKHEREVKWL